ncbi:hypothetical protein [Sulfitobacter pontiacus]|uniref:lipopolysaccharide biosynthesis protein n=1 Tax=Sulfitobacter pontiacus TaxID=60137 RepID=UPI0030ECB24B
MMRAHRPNFEFFTIAVGRVASLLAAVASLKLLTVYLSVEEFGRFGLALAGANATAMLLFSAYGQGMFRFTNPLVERGQYSRLRHLLVTQLWQISLTIIAISAVLITLVRSIFPNGPWTLVALAVVAGLLLGIRIVQFNAIQAMRARKTAALLQAISGFSGGLVGVPFALLITPEGEWAMAGVIIFLIVLVIVQMIIVNQIILLVAYKTASSEVNSAPADENFFQFCKPLVLVFGLTALASYSDKFLAAELLTLTEAAVLIAFLQIARSISIMSVGITMQFIYPIVFAGTDRSEVIAKKRYRQVLIAWLLVLAGVGVVSLIVWGASEPLVRLLTTDAYTSFASLLPSLIFAVALPQAARLLEAVGMRAYSTNRYIIPKIIEAGAMILVLILALPTLGIWGVPIAYALSGLLLSIGYLIVNQKV